MHSDSKTLGDIFKWATIKLGGYRGAVVDDIQARVWTEIGISEQNLCKVAVSLLSKYITEMKIMSDW